MIYRDAGGNAAAALTARTKTEHLLKAKVAAKAAGVKIEEVPVAWSGWELNRLSRLLRTAARMLPQQYTRTAAEEFLRIAGKTFANEITQRTSCFTSGGSATAG